MISEEDLQSFYVAMIMDYNSSAKALIQNRMLDRGELTHFAMSMSEGWMRKMEELEVPLDSTLAGAFVDGMLFGMYLQEKQTTF